jgi:hypothetical protein
MKTKLLLLATLTFLSCQKNAEQIAIAKKQISSKYKAAETAAMQYNCLEILDKDAYKTLAANAREDSQNLSNAGQYEAALKSAENAGKYLDSSNNATEKKFYRINYYRITSKDTVNKGFILLNDANKKIGFIQE